MPPINSTPGIPHNLQRVMTGVESLHHVCDKASP
jgi:hypothetical protein